MMVAIFATLFLALAMARFGPRSMAMICFLACLALTLGEFLWEVYSPDYGFRMPWIQVERDRTPIVGAVT